MELEISIRNFVSGREKNRLTDFWHIRIEEEVIFSYFLWLSNCYFRLLTFFSSGSHMAINV